MKSFTSIGFVLSIAVCFIETQALESHPYKDNALKPGKLFTRQLRSAAQNSLEEDGLSKRSLLNFDWMKRKPPGARGERIQRRSTDDDLFDKRESFDWLVFGKRMPPSSRGARTEKRDGIDSSEDDSVEKRSWWEIDWGKRMPPSSRGSGQKRSPWGRGTKYDRPHSSSNRQQNLANDAKNSWLGYGIDSDESIEDEKRFYNAADGLLATGQGVGYNDYEMHGNDLYQNMWGNEDEAAAANEEKRFFDAMLSSYSYGGQGYNKYGNDAMQGSDEEIMKRFRTMKIKSRQKQVPAENPEV